jgi:hypothetical protein
MPSHIWEDPSPDVAELPQDSPAYRADLNRRLGLAYLSGAEEWSRIMESRGLTVQELHEALNGHPGDLPDLPDEHVDQGGSARG